MFLCLYHRLLIVEQKEKLSEVEQQLKKAEAAQRRRLQNEKAARESEVWFLGVLCFFCFRVLSGQSAIAFLLNLTG